MVDMARLKVVIAGVVFLGWALAAAALEPPVKGEIEKYRKDGTLEQRLAAARALGNHEVAPRLVQRAHAKLQRLLGVRGPGTRATGGPEKTPPSAWQGMPTSGNVKILALLIAFSDYPPAAANTNASVNGKLFGDGDPTRFPYESLRNFYRRSSYNQLEIGGSTLGWYTTAYPRSDVDTNEDGRGRVALIKEALNSFDASHDFSQYDNDGDGYIDYFVVIWTGPAGEWASFWWGYKTSFSDSTFVLDGKRLGDYSWQWEANPAGGTFYPTVVIHETGHALGLPDYYDYNGSLGPDGGVGRLDQMDGNWGDHNCFSKFLLDWITPTTFSGGTNPASLRASHSYPDAAVFTKGAVAGQEFGEFFMVQNRQRGQNDVASGSYTPYPTDGLLIWHVDSRLNAGGTNYLYNNSYTEHKLLRLMEADGLEEIEAGSNANAGDYYNSGETFGPTTLPASSKYDGTPSRMGVRSISANGSPMTLEIFEVADDATPPTGAPTTPTDEGAVSTDDSLAFAWTQGTAADPESGISGYHIQIGTTPGGNDMYDANVGNVLGGTLSGCRDGATHYARVRAVNEAGLFSNWSGNSDGILVNLPVFSCAALDNCALTFKTTGNQLWTGQATYSFYGGSAGRSGTIGHEQQSSVQTTVVGPGDLSFYWKVSSEQSYDYLSFYIDGTRYTRISGEVDWTQRTYSIAAGTHTLRWVYAKDQAAVGGIDAAFLDRVQWTGAASPPIVTSVSPGFGPAAGGTGITITGSAFVSGATVTVGGTAAAATFVNSTTMTATTPAHATGLVAVAVRNPDTQTGTLAEAFFYGPPAVARVFVPLTPCRVLDTRNATGPLGGPSLQSAEIRSFVVITTPATCGIPSNAVTLSINLTAVSPPAAGELRLFPGNASSTNTSALSFSIDRARANNAHVVLSTDGTGSFKIHNDSAGSVHVVVDVNGYYR
jgi:M6 family metalloprotease-like protein